MKGLRSMKKMMLNRQSLAACAGAVIVTGAVWYGLAAEGRAAVAATAPAAGIAPAVTTSAQAPSRLAGRQDSYADVVGMVSPAVVTVRTFDDRFDGMPGPTPAPKLRGLGSGVVVSPDGYILTNSHVIDGASEVTADLPDGRTLSARVVGADKPSDLALLKIDASGLLALSLGNSDAVRVGDVVLAFGNPLGIGQTVTMGIVSAKGRATGVGDGSYEDFLQTDAPINHGNSGGALVNVKGELVGINSQIVSMSSGNIGIGFAIPANMARHVMDDLRTNGRVRRAQLGITVQPVTSDMAASLGLKDVGGAIVSGVEAGSAADHGGLKRGDVVKSFNGQPVRDTNSLRNRVAESALGSTASVAIVRDGGERTLSVTLDEAASSRTARAEASSEGDREALGVSVAPLTPETASRMGAPRDAKGVVVRDVRPDSRAADAGIQPGDIIQEVNRRPVETTDDLRRAVRAADGKPTLLLVHRDGRDLFLTVKPS